MMEVDPRFKASSARSRKRRTRRMALLASAGVGSTGILLLLVWLVFVRGWSAAPGEIPLDGPALVQVELEDDESAAAAPIRSSTAFVDIPGDPMILTFADSAVAQGRRLPGTDALPVDRVGPMRPDRLMMVGDDLIATEQRLMTTLPSSREDFAFFQAQRSAAFEPQASAAQPAAAAVDLGDFGDSWGESLETGRDGADFFRETRIQNTTSISYLRPENRRSAIYEDLVLRVRVDQPLEELLQSNGFPADLSAKLAADATAVVPAFATIPAGSILAIRLDEYRGKRPLQMSLYVDGALAGSITRLRDGEVLAGADPWIGEDLTRLGQRDEVIAADNTQVRLLDALYSAAIRNGIPTTLVGEAMAMISQAYDLDDFASDGDKMSFLYAPEGRTGVGQILFVGIDGPSGRKACYVVASKSGGYGCAGHSPAGAGTIGGGLLTPVSGTMSSGFGPRRHPILKTVKQHNGVDWAAPTGTPVVAALDGQVKSAGIGGGYGNLVILTHPGGLETRYAHLNAFADGLNPGNPVSAGDLIGYVGTTGRSTGPHLHFELWSGGRPVNPLAYGGVGSGVIDALAEQIIRVESAGNATARNPLSTATGLGQFIESTWLRMMQDYEPELVSTMSRRDLLALRTDPELSRRMVMNLARENENYLKTRGHQVTAGRLYLAHFLGPVGADRALRAPDDATVLDVMGAAVVNANPFLRGYKIADLEAWADRKMRGRGQAAPTVMASAPRLTAEDREFMRIVDTILQEAS